MRTRMYLLPAVIFVAGLLSCRENKHSPTVTQRADSPIAVAPKAKEVFVDPIPDSIPRLVTDDYPVTNDMFKPGLDNTGNKTIVSGGLISGDKVWYTNDSLQQTLVFELYTDYHRLWIYHFDNHDIPAGLIGQIELNTADGDIATDRQKQKDFKGFLRQATQIGTSYFTSNKGFRLGDTKQKAIAAYGRPDSDKTVNGIETLNWRFTGDTFYSDTTRLKGKPVAKDSYGCEVTMYFRSNKLIGQAIRNDIP